MNYVRRMVVFLIAQCALGCGGTIDDYGGYENTELPSSNPGWEPSEGDVADGGPAAPPADRAEPGRSGVDPAMTGRSEPGSGWDDDTAGASGWDDGSSGAAPAADACDFPALVEEKCGNATCHGAPALDSGLDLTSAGLGARLADRAGPGPCADLPMIDHDDPEMSALYLKITGSTCGRPMPPSGPLSSDDQACFLTWIEGLDTRADGGASEDPAAGSEDPSMAGGGMSPPDETAPGWDDGADEPATSDADEPPCDFSGLVELRCGGSSCHGAPADLTGLDLTSPSLAARLSTRGGPPACADTSMIDRADPAGSALYLKVSSTECGTQMPPGAPLAPDEQRCFLSWIEGL